MTTMLALHTEDVVLRDGSTLRLRPPTADDEGALISFFASMSPESRYLRFHGATVIGRQTVSVALETDWASRGSLVGELADDAGHLTAVAVATYVRLRDPKRAEVAFAVADELHGRGIGTRLLERLAEHAAEVGVEEFVAEVLPGNAAMLRVFDDAGFETARALQDGVVEVVLHLDHTRPAVVERRDERDHVAVAASLKPFFEPRSVAVMGASPRRGTIGGELFRNILAADYTGAAYPINRSGDAVGGVPGYKDITDVPVVVDLVVICVPGEHVLEAARSALGTGVKAVCVISAGFAETGAEGKQRQDELLALVRAHGARLIGPNCLGIATNATRLNATFARRSAPAGRIGFSSQSGALGLALLEEADARGLGLSSFVSIGNKADVSSNDLLEYWQDDPNTDVVLLYLESFGNPRKFARVASRVARTKPILAMRSGTSRAGARAASSHTAALAGSDAAVEALFWQAGVLRARTLEELLDAAVLFSTQPLPRGNRVAVLTNAGGLGILCADACEAAGLSLPGLADATVEALERVVPAEASSANPVDLLGSATADTYEVALPIVLADPGIDAVIVLFVPPVVATTADVSAAIARASVGADKPVLPVVISADGSPAGSFTYPESAARALGLAARRAAWLRRPAPQAPHLDRIDHGAVAAIVARTLENADDVWLEPGDLRALLQAYGLPVVGERLAPDAEAAVAAAVDLGFPVVVKTAAAGAHKTETGGVHLDLRDEAAVRRAGEAVGGPVLVQQYVTGGAELLAGAIQDPVFGPLVAFGPGGVYAELIGSTRFALAPLGEIDVEELISSGKAAKLVDGWRGAAPADRAAVADLIHRLGRLAEDFPEVAELDLNPVIARPDGCIAVDARVRLSRPAAATTSKTW
ncbi:MAG TPA: GNAT family N-acetyltransferase [Gaiellaceae bacterium]|nr:GNAT family N-acetyltransferase [Gaiellaceae bacterium]